VAPGAPAEPLGRHEPSNANGAPAAARHCHGRHPEGRPGLDPPALGGCDGRPSSSSRPPSPAPGAAALRVRPGETPWPPTLSPLTPAREHRDPTAPQEPRSPRWRGDGDRSGCSSSFAAASAGELELRAPRSCRSGRLGCVTSLHPGPPRVTGLTARSHAAPSPELGGHGSPRPPPPPQQTSLTPGSVSAFIFY